jgi:hypothetical protein
MTDADKAPYVQLAVQDKLRYEAEMAEYRAYAAANAAAASAARPALPGEMRFAWLAVVAGLGFD